MKKLIITALLLVVTSLVAAGCWEADADVASRNLSKAADNFEVSRRIVFINGITDKYLLVIEGACSLGNDDPKDEQSVTCKTGPGQYKKHFVHLSDNVTVVTEQLEDAKVSKDHYRVTFKPSTIVPDFDVRGTSEGVDN